MIRKIQKLLLYAGVALLAASCTFEKEIDVPTPKQEIATVRFTLSVPGVATPKPSSRSLTDAQEDAVSSVDVLVFHTSGDYSGKLFRREKGTHISGNTFEVKLPEGTYDLAVFGNATSIIENAASSLVPQVATKTAAIASLVHANSGGYWTDTTIPMWGYADGVEVNETTSLTGDDAIDMHRMVAKIEVQVAATAAGTDNDNFALTSVRLYNYNTNGRVAPDMANFDPTGGIVNAGKGIATAPTLPSTLSSVTGVDNPLVFEAAKGVTANNLLNTIYTYEATKGSALTLEDNPCLVIGGSYQEGTPTYYRVDFVQKSGDTYTYLDLLRNHNYSISINSVTGKGHETPEEAFNSRSFNIEVNIMRWENGGITGVVFDGQNFLGVSQDAFELTREARGADDEDNKLKIRTDVPTGWTAVAYGNLAGTVAVPDDGVTGNPWLRISPASGDGADTDANTMTLEMDANESSAERTAYIHIKAGRLTYVVKVTQTLASNLSLILRDPVTLVEFQEYEWIAEADATPEDVKFDLLWGPRTSDVTITNVKGEAISSGMFIFDQTAGYKYIVPGNSTLPGGVAASGKENYKIRPLAVSAADLLADPFYDKSSKIEFTVNDGQNGVIKKSIVLRHWIGEYKVMAETDDWYLMNGSSGNEFTIKANADFTVEIASEAGNNPTAGDGNPVVTLDNGVAGVTHAANTAGTTLRFTIANEQTNPIVNVAYVKLIIKSPTNQFADKEVILYCVSGIVQPESNSYIVTAGGSPILIPVSRANASSLGTQIGSGVTYTVEMLWSESSTGVAANGNISYLLATGTGPNGYILLRPGSAQGNAVVAVKVGANIVWSWHIWVCNSNNMPQNLNGFMNRYLGSFATWWTVTPTVLTRGDAAMGLYYQWGRKDPFPNTNQPAYYKTGYSIVNITGNTLQNAVRNPTKMITTGNVTDIGAWTGSDQSDRSKSWNNGTADYKTVYDPCPPGWRVPRLSDITSAGGTWDISSVYGVKNNMVGGNYPAIGYRQNATVFFIGKDVRVWTVEYDTNYSCWGGFQGSQFSDGGYHDWGIPRTSYSNDGFTYSYAAPIRCIAE